MCFVLFNKYRTKLFLRDRHRKRERQNYKTVKENAELDSYNREMMTGDERRHSEREVENLKPVSFLVKILHREMF